MSRPNLSLWLIACAGACQPLLGAYAAPVPVPLQLSLAEAMRVALAHNAQLQQQAADVDIAAAASDLAKAPTRPTVSATTYGTAGNTNNVVSSSPGVMPQNLFVVPAHAFVDQNITAMIPLWTGGTLAGTARGAALRAHASRFDYDAQAVAVRQVVTDAYVSVLLQAARVDVAAARWSAESTHVRDAAEKVETGRLAPVDLLREQAEQADAQQQLTAARTAAAVASTQLKRAIGISQLTDVQTVDTLDIVAENISVSATTLDAVLVMAAAHRPELAAAQQQADAAQAEVSAAQGLAKPQIYGLGMADAASSGGGARPAFTVGVTISLPLDDGGLARARTAEARARWRRARADAEDVAQRVAQETASAWWTWASTPSQVAAANAGVTAAAKASELAELRYQAGKSILAERLDASAALTRAQGTLAEAKAARVLAAAALIAATGDSVSEAHASP